MRNFGKASGPLLLHKKDFFLENNKHLEYSQSINDVYSKQPRRTKCKNCNHELGQANFKKMGVEYALCSLCGHLNGLHEDALEFCKFVYSEGKGSGYANNYAVSNQAAYLSRVKDIYRPKAVFLKEALKELGEEPESLKFADLGAGSGYFVRALRDEGMKKSIGYEVSESQVELANLMNEAELLLQHKIEDLNQIAGNLEADVVSLIGVLEHVREPRILLRRFTENVNLKYLYLSVPTFSPSVFFGMVFPSVMNRQLYGGHTHLYTEQSLKWMANEFNLKNISSWWFGTDIVDLYRSIYVSLKQQPEMASMVDKWEGMMKPLIDDLQLVIDKQHLSSEVHIVYKLDR